MAKWTCRMPARRRLCFRREKPEYVFLAAARVGGILANSSRPVDFLRDNLLMETSVLDAAWRHGVKKVLCLGSSCIYPKFAPQPIREDSLLSGPLEPTNEWYAIAKIAGIKLAQAYHRQYGMEAISLMPTNLYGPGDNFDLETSHVVPALLRKFHEAVESGAPEVTLWGSGSPRQGIPARGRSCRRGRVPDGALLEPGDRQRRGRRRPDDSGAGGNDRTRSPAFAASCASTARSPTERRANCWTCPG